MVAQCLDRRIPNKALLVSEIKRWERGRHTEKARINWLFTVEREKLGPSYPPITQRPAKAAA